MSTLARRHLITGAAALGGVAVGAATTRALSDDTAPELTHVEHHPHSRRQAGVETAAGLHAALVGLDLVAGDRDSLTRLLRLLGDDAKRLAEGRAPLADTEPELAMRPAGLSVTFGFGPRAAALIGRSVTRLPRFSTDRLQERWGQTDLVLQVESNDPTSLSHALRVLLKDTRTLARRSWIQRGFRDLAGADGKSMRNLMGQVDGTVNPKTAADYDALVWSDDATEMVVRRIEINQDTWDKVDRVGREFTVGRRLDTGAPLTGTHEFDEPDFAAVDKVGFPVIDPASHLRRARGGARGPQFLRRGYNYDDTAHGDGVGLVFVAFARDLELQFTPVQQRLAEQDLLNRWVTTIGSATYYIPTLEELA